MRPVCLLMVFSTINTTLPHDLIRDKLIHLIGRTFNREGTPYLACTDRNTLLFDLAPSCIDKKLGFLWAPIVLPCLPIYYCFVMRGTL